jgi:hypothetical protein
LAEVDPITRPRLRSAVLRQAQDDKKQAQDDKKQAQGEEKQAQGDKKQGQDDTGA